MKPRVYSPGHAIPIERDENGKVVRRYDKARRVWYVDYEDTCGCTESEEFSTQGAALRFAQHIANGGSRWEFAA